MLIDCGSEMVPILVNLDMTDSMGPGKLVRHMQNLSYTYDEYLICIGLGPSISSVIGKNLSYSDPSYPSSPVPSYLYKIQERRYQISYIYTLQPYIKECPSLKVLECRRSALEHIILIVTNGLQNLYQLAP